MKKRIEDINILPILVIIAGGFLSILVTYGFCVAVVIIVNLIKEALC